MKRRSGNAAPHTSRESWLLNEPETCHEILKYHHALSSFLQQFQIRARNRLTPPFIVDSPRFEDGFDVSDRPAIRPSDRHKTGFMQFHGDGAGLVYGSPTRRAAPTACP